MVKVAIVEDDSSDAQLLSDYVKKYGQENGIDFSIKVFSQGEIFLIEYKTGFDIVYLDIEMPGIDGVKTAQKLRKIDEKVAIIFVTNLAHRAIDGYTVDALNYIVKPFSYADFVLKMNVVKRRLAVSGNDLFTIQGARSITNVPLNEIFYVEVFGHYLTYHTARGDITARGTIKEAESSLFQYNFIRISNSHIVNLTKIEKLKGSTITINGAELVISRTYKRKFLEAFSEIVNIPTGGGGER
jgi:DNA-binding LytR/AlgR family response regulator